MANKFPIKIAAAIVLLIIFWWLWPSGEQSVADTGDSVSSGARELVSSIKPISEADAAAQRSGEAATLRSSISPQAKAISEAELQRRFASVSQTIKSGRTERAINELGELINDYPQVIEPYINLASLYADSGQFDLSRATLEQAINANPNTATLFQSIQKVYAAQAAEAYRLALSDQADLVQNIPEPELKLPLIASINTSEARDNLIDLLQQEVEQKQASNSALQNRLAALEAKASEQQAQAESAQVKSLQQQLAASSSTIEKLTSRAESAENQISDKQAEYDSEVTTLRDQLAAQSALNQQLRSREQSFISQIEQQQSDVDAARLQARVDQQTAAEERVAAQQIAAAKRERERLERQAADQLAAEQQLERDQASQAKRQADALRTAAVSLVESWAARWSAQDVTGYVAHYQQDYVPPSSGLSHRQWLEQRRVRLTNKRFINVDVSEFSVQDQGSQFVVTFTQHYRSNTVDDRIRKKLVFSKQSSDLSASKIVGEQVVSR